MTQFVNTRWGDFAFEDSGGSKNAVLFLHGGASNLRAWDNVVPVLDGFLRCVRIDLPGHGLTPTSPLSFSQLRESILDICRRLELGKPLLVGHSFGGLVAAYAANEPDVAKGVMAIDPYLSDDEVRRRFSNVTEALNEIKTMTWPWPETDNVDAQVEVLAQSIYTPREDNKNLIAMIRRGYRQTERGTYIRYPRPEEEMVGIRANWSVNVTETFMAVKTPLSIVIAKVDSVGRLNVRQSILEKISKVMPNFDSLLVGCGHDVPGYKARELGNYIKTWGNSIPS